MPFRVQGGDVKDIFVTEEELIERFTGKQLWMWGYGACAQIGDNFCVSRSSPVQTISGGVDWKSASAGSFQTAATKTDGTLWMWGFGTNGQLGNNSTLNLSSPVQTISGGTNWRTVSAGDHTAAIKTDGTLWLWGPGAFGRLGNNAITDRSSPVQTISAGTNWQSVNVNACHTVATKTDGTLWLWGNGPLGQLGNNAITGPRSSPVQTISGGTNWRSASTGREHTVATKTDGTLWTWGSGTQGQLGNNATTNRSSPVQTVSGGTNWRSVDADGCHTAAIKTDGTLWLWGKGNDGILGAGHLGNNSTTNRSSPVQTISGGTNWRSVSVGYNHTTATKTDGTLWTWGVGSVGRLGDITLINRSSPVQTISGGTNWRTVNAGRGHNAATRLEEF